MYTVRWADGSTSHHDKRGDALASVRKREPAASIERPDEAADPNRTLFWADEAASDADDGARAAGCIVRCGQEGPPAQVLGADWEEYWGTVIGSLPAPGIVHLYELDLSDRRDVDEWIGSCEEEAIRDWGLDREFHLAAWKDHHTRALDELLSVQSSELDPGATVDAEAEAIADRDVEV
jgi:hypothetical protein